MTLAATDLMRIANLAQLELAPAEATEILDKINSFLSLVQAMQQVPTEGVVPLAHPVEVAQAMALRLRPDVVSEFNQRDVYLQNAPSTDRGLFLVPKVIE